MNCLQTYSYVCCEVTLHCTVLGVGLGRSGFVNRTFDGCVTETGKAMQVAPENYDNPSFKDGAVELSNVNGDTREEKRREAEINGNKNGLPPYDTYVDTVPKGSRKGSKGDADKTGDEKDENEDEKKEETKLVSVTELVSNAYILATVAFDRSRTEGPILFQ